MDFKNIKFEDIAKGLDRIIREVKNFVGELTGTSKCLHCKDNWAWKEQLTIWYSNSSGMFPLCKECFNELDINMIDIYVRQHIGINNSQHWREDSELKQVYKSAMEKVKELKDSQN